MAKTIYHIQIPKDYFLTNTGDVSADIHAMNRAKQAFIENISKLFNPDSNMQYCLSEIEKLHPGLSSQITITPIEVNPDNIVVIEEKGWMK